MLEAEQFHLMRGGAVTGRRASGELTWATLLKEPCQPHIRCSYESQEGKAMPKKEKLNNARHASQIIEARAGLIPASDYIEDEANACIAQIARTVRVYAKLTDGRDDLAIADLLHDLRYYCDSKALTFDELDKAAYEQYMDDASEGLLPARPRAS